MPTITIGFGDREMLWEGSLATLDKQLDAAELISKRTNADIARAAAEVVDKDAVIDHLRGGLDQLMMLLTARRPWWRRWLR